MGTGSSMNASHTTLSTTASKKNVKTAKNQMPVDTEVNQEKIVDLMQRVGQMHKNQNILKPIVGVGGPVRPKIGGQKFQVGASGGIIVGNGLQKMPSQDQQNSDKKQQPLKVTAIKGVSADG